MINQPLMAKLADWAESSYRSPRERELVPLNGFPRVRLNMGSWFWSSRYMVSIAELREGECDSAACLAGAVVMLTTPEGTQLMRNQDLILLPDGRRLTFQKYAQAELNMDADMADYLFHVSDAAAVRGARFLAEYPEATLEELREEIDPLDDNSEDPEPEEYEDEDPDE